MWENFLVLVIKTILSFIFKKVNTFSFEIFVFIVYSIKTSELLNYAIPTFGIISHHAKDDLFPTINAKILAASFASILPFLVTSPTV